jgi:hypothetical protein
LVPSALPILYTSAIRSGRLSLFNTAILEFSCTCFVLHQQQLSFVLLFPSKIVVAQLEFYKAEILTKSLISPAVPCSFPRQPRKSPFHSPATTDASLRLPSTAPSFTRELKSARTATYSQSGIFTNTFPAC